MLIEFIAATAAAFVGAGSAMLLRHLSGGRLPRILIPVAAAIGMFGFTIWGEYSWYDRTAQSLPEGIVVVRAQPEPSSFRPWTYLKPYTSRFMAVDTQAIRTNQAVPDQRLAEVIVFARLEPVRTIPLLVDCQAKRRADIVDGMNFGESGTITNADWQDMEAEDPLLRAICS
ncbi:MAG: hypothetical protein AAGF44_04255 [Pseudomonadota bacterium]